MYDLFQRSVKLQALGDSSRFSFASGTICIEPNKHVAQQQQSNGSKNLDFLHYSRIIDGLAYK